MQILHKLDDFFFTLFPEIREKDDETVIKTLEAYYTYGSHIPIVRIKGGWVTVEIDAESILTEESDFMNAVDLCERGKYSDAKPILKELIRKNPTKSEYHRILGQVYSEEGDQEEAINTLIDALLWDAKNGRALLMMGNIIAKYRKDLNTAKKYYDQALVVNPNDHITMCNIGVNMMQQGSMKDAKEYFEKALWIDASYPNAYHGLAMMNDAGGDYENAFENAIKAVKFNTNKDALLRNSIKLAFDTAGKVLKTEIGQKVMTRYRHKLEFEGGREIELQTDEKIGTPAKIEFAENYKREKHRVIYKPSYPAVEHLVVHELVHLDFVIQARKEGINQVFYSDESHKKEFLKRLDADIKNFGKQGYPEETVSKVFTDLFAGLNLQAYNAPIDLFIEDYIYKEFSDFRPYQFVSLYNMITEGVKAVTDPNIVKLFPKTVISKSKIYNLVNAVYFKDVFGINLISEFHPTPAELRQARELFEEFLEYREDRKPGEEYELVANWGEDLGLDKYFELEGEIQYRKRSSLETYTKALEEDPLGIKDRDPVKEREMKKFTEGQKEIGVNMAVVMYMVEALGYFEGMDQETIKKIAVEIAFLGTQGFSTEKDGYTVKSIPGKTFSGYRILAYYYVSWMLAMPEMIEKLGLPYEKEYKMALTLRKPEK